MSAEPFVSDPDFTLYNGDVRDVLAGLPAESVDCALTSPPFYALRDYGTGQWEGGDPACDHALRQDVKVASSTLGGGKATSRHQREGYKSECGRCGAQRVDRQIGLEETPEEWAQALVGVFREVRRVLKPEGTLWVECGDSYVSGQGGRQSAVGELPTTTRFDRKEAGRKRDDVDVSSWGERDVGPRFYPTRETNLKPKDLLGQPWLLAFALRADGWWLRQAIIWHKPNAMPESATDRCTTAHSYVFLLSKQARYHFDAEAIAEPAEWARWGDQTNAKYKVPDGWAQEGEHDTVASSSKRPAGSWIPEKTKQELTGENRPGKRGDTYSGFNERWKASGRKGNGQRERDDKLRGFDERTDRADGLKNARSVWTIPTQGYPDAHFATWPEALVERIIKAGCPEGGTVLDPFLGSGTTALVARRHGRKSIGIELNESYCALAAKRLGQQSLLAEGTA